MGSNTDPRTRLIKAMVLIFISFLSNSILVQSALIAAILISELISCKTLKSFKTMGIVLSVVLLQVMFIQLLFGREGNYLTGIWIFSVYSQSLYNACLGILRTSSVALSAIQFISHIKSREFTLMLISFGISYRYAMLGEFTERFLPVITAEYNSICESNSVRGYECGNFFEKLKALPSTIMPLIYRCIRKTNDAALSMELRGFGSNKQRTFFTQIKYKPIDYILTFVYFAVLIVSLKIKIKI